MRILHPPQEQEEMCELAGRGKFHHQEEEPDESQDGGRRAGKKRIRHRRAGGGRANRESGERRRRVAERESDGEKKVDFVAVKVGPELMWLRQQSLPVGFPW